MASDSDTDPAPDPCTRRSATGPGGTELTVCAHGGHVLGWTPAGGTRPRLWISPLAECGPGAAIRGGIPVIFPQFGGRGPLPKHGLARDRAWLAPDGPRVTGGGLEWSATLTDDDATREIWPHRFELTLTARATGDTLETELTVRNRGDSAWEFTAALHTYLALGAPEASIHGIGGRTAEDNTDGGRPVRLGARGAPLTATTARDVAVLDAAGPLTLDDPVLGPLLIEADGFGDRVIWNPGPGAGPGDVPAGAEREFVCIEPAALSPVRLAASEVWSGRQRLVQRG